MGFGYAHRFSQNTMATSRLIRKSAKARHSLSAYRFRTTRKRIQISFSTITAFYLLTLRTGKIFATKNLRTKSLTKEKLFFVKPLVLSDLVARLFFAACVTSLIYRRFNFIGRTTRILGLCRLDKSLLLFHRKHAVNVKQDEESVF